MKILIVVLSLLFLNCWPLTFTKTIDCYMNDADACAKMEMIKSNCSGYEIVKIRKDNKVKVKFFRWKSNKEQETQVDF